MALRNILVRLNLSISDEVSVGRISHFLDFLKLCLANWAD
jgi:hypothetical protein